MNQITTNNIQDTEKTNITPVTPRVTYKMRCPECVTLYEVDALKIQTVVPEFECPKCQCLFGFDYPPMNPNSILTFKIPSVEFDFKKNCPKCQHYQSDRNQICESCGVVMENYILIQNEAYPKVSVELIKMWQKVISDFESVEINEQFIRKCISREATDYALFKYKELAKTLNDTKSCDKWIGFLNESLREQTDRNKIVVQRTNSADTAYLASLISKLKHPQWQLIMFLVPILIGSFLILFGLFKSGYRNGIGGGIALLILTFGFIAFRRRG